MQLAPPPVDLKANPTLHTLHDVERILRAAREAREGPLTLAEIGRRMPAKAVRFDVIKTAVGELARHHEVAIGSKGVTWVVVDEHVWRRPAEPLA